MLSAVIRSERSQPARALGRTTGTLRGSSSPGPSRTRTAFSSLLTRRRIGTELFCDVLNPARVLALMGRNSPTSFGTNSSPRMRRADIEVPNHAVDVPWARLSLVIPGYLIRFSSDGASMLPSGHCSDLSSPVYVCLAVAPCALSALKSDTTRLREPFGVSLRYIFRRQPPQLNYLIESNVLIRSRTEVRYPERPEYFSTLTPQPHWRMLQSLPPILHKPSQTPILVKVLALLRPACVT